MFSSVVIGVLALTGVIVLLVMLLMLCERQLVRKGAVKLLINDDPAKSPTVAVGSNLLMALSSQQLFLPSACGGKGSCAMCKCQVLEGGGDILPSERTHISRSEAKRGWRLACQVKVRGPMKIRVPDHVDSGNVVRIAYDRYRTSFGAGLSKVAGQVFRIGHLGDCNEVMCLAALAAAEISLNDAGAKVELGAGVAAAQAYYSQYYLEESAS